LNLNNLNKCVQLEVKRRTDHHTLLPRALSRSNCTADQPVYFHVHYGHLCSRYAKTRSELLYENICVYNGHVFMSVCSMFVYNTLRNAQNLKLYNVHAFTHSDV